MVYLILNGVEITSREQLEMIIADLHEETKIELRLIFNNAEALN